MASAAIAFPILPGKTDPARRFAAEVKSRSDEFTRSVSGRGLTREDWYIQSAPQGDMVIVVMEGENPQATLHSWAASNDPFDVWFKNQAGEISGIDFNQPIPCLPEHAFAWRK